MSGQLGLLFRKPQLGFGDDDPTKSLYRSPFGEAVIRGLFISFLVATLCACAEDERGRVSYYDQATEHIENRNFEYAISLMTDVLRGNSQDHRARVILASAHAARAGIYLSSYSSLIQELIDSEDKQKSHKRATNALSDLQAQTESEDQKKVLGWVIDANKAIAHVATFLNAFEKVPTVNTKEQFEDLKQAIRVLSKDPTLKGGALIYRAFLRVVLFRYHLENHYRFSEITRCDIGSPELKKKLQQLKKEVNMVLMDLANGIQDQKPSERLKKNAEDMDLSFDKAGETQLPPLLALFGGRCA